MKSLGRNDPCPCGSGKKYKLCCGMPAKASSPSAVVTVSAAQVQQMLQVALAHHQAGRFSAAEALYRQVITRMPEQVDALHLLGVLLHQSGQHALAVEWISRAVSLQPDFAEAHSNLGEAWRAMGRWDEAAASYSRALQLKPDYPQAHHNFALCLHAQGRWNDAVASFQQAILLKPDYVDALLALTRLLQAQGELKKALLCCQRLLQVKNTQTSSDTHWSLYADILALLSDTALALVDQDLLLQAFTRQEIDPQKLERIATALVCHDDFVPPLLTLAEMPSGATKIAGMLADGSLSRLLAMPLLLALLEHTLITDYRLEKLLVQIRQGLLFLAQAEAGIAAEINTSANMDDESERVVLRFTCALALQCFANEYIYISSEAEELAGAELATEIAAKLNNPQTSSAEVGLPSVKIIWQLSLLGCYQALYRYPFAEQISGILQGSTQKHVQALFERQLHQPLQEESLKLRILSITGVADAVSQAVRQQYEENPYPRWQRRGKLGAGMPLTQALQQRLPYCAIPTDLPESPKILVAGCGTGSDAFQVAQSFAHTGMLAVDMSKTSLAYAIRATRAFGVEDIDFRHGDILELGSLDRQFDLIVCSGVLHHMREPMAGWQVLTDLLQPDGYMNIGLYSRRARREVTGLRQLVVEKGYAGTREGISHFRRDVMQGERGIELGDVAITPDFYSTSACRDLIFHVQEHVYSPLEIRDCLGVLGLEFLGFEFSNPEIRNRYIARFPDNPACDSLENWEVVESDNPAIFAGMYQFWVRKRAS